MMQSADVYAVSNDDAIETLQKTLPEANGITPKYVHAGDTAASLGIQLRDTTITVLGPEEDIDGYYLGEDPEARCAVSKRPVRLSVSTPPAKRWRSPRTSGSPTFDGCNPG